MTRFHFYFYFLLKMNSTPSTVIYYFQIKVTHATILYSNSSATCTLYVHEGVMHIGKTVCITWLRGYICVSFDIKGGIHSMHRSICMIVECACSDRVSKAFIPLVEYYAY